MPSAGRPAGPGAPQKKARDDAAEREEIDETLSAAREDERVKRTGADASREQPSPRVNNEALPGDEPPRGGQQEGRRSH